MSNFDLGTNKNEEEEQAMSKPQGLGRGLNALFSDEENTSLSADVEKKIVEEATAEGSSRKPFKMGVEVLCPSTAQPRRIFNDQSLDELALSIREHGILQPLLVRKVPDGSEFYEIIAGERRWQAAQRAQLHEVPVIVLEIDDLEAYKIALIENLQREDLDPIEEAKGLDSGPVVEKKITEEEQLPQN